MTSENKPIPKPRKPNGPRPAATYRGARRNATRATGALMPRRGPEPRFISLCRYIIPLNRSQNHPRARSYAHARDLSPSTRPVT
jgi:hypothetical protein